MTAAYCGLCRQPATGHPATIGHLDGCPEAFASDVVLIGCVQRKQPRMQMFEARDLYVSPLFAKRRAYAEASGKPWLILSALHGIVAPEQTLFPYNVRLTRPTVSGWSGMIRFQLERRYPQLDGMRFEIHAGAEYVDGFERAARWLSRFAAPPARVEIVTPLRGMAIGRQLAWYNALR